MSNRFLTKSGTNVDLTDGSIPFYGSSLGAINLNTAKAVKTNNSGVLYSTNLQISDVDGLQTAINGALTNPASSNLNMNAQKIHNATDVSGSSNSLKLLSATDSVNLTLIDTKTEINKPIDMKNNIIINGGPITASTATIPIIQGSADDLGTLTIRGNSFAPNGTVAFLDETPSYTYTSGALVVSGGIGVAGNIYGNGNINIGTYNITSGSLTTSICVANSISPRTVSGAFTVNNSGGTTIATFNNDLSMTTGSISAGSSTITGATISTDAIQTKTTNGALTVKNSSGTTIATFNNDLSITAGSIAGTITTATQSLIDHNSLNNLTTLDPHTQYTLNAGRVGGQIIYGGSVGGATLTLYNNTDVKSGIQLSNNAFTPVSSGMVLGSASPAPGGKWGLEANTISATGSISCASLSTDVVGTKTASGNLVLQNQAGSTIATFKNDLSTTVGSLSCGAMTSTTITNSGNATFGNNVTALGSIFTSGTTALQRYAEVTSTTSSGGGRGAYLNIRCQDLAYPQIQIMSDTKGTGAIMFGGGISGGVNYYTDGGGIGTAIITKESNEINIGTWSGGGGVGATLGNPTKRLIISTTTGAVSTNGGSLSCGALTATGNILPSGTDGAYDVGRNVSPRWNNVYSIGGSIALSNRNEKKEIQDTDLGLSFVQALKPRKYKVLDGTRPHYGLVAQEVKETMDDLKISDFAGYITGKERPPMSDEDKEKQANGEEVDMTKYPEVEYFGLRYHEFISPLIKAIQELSARVSALENP